MVVSGKKSARQDRRAATQSINADLLRRALHWVLDDNLFQGVRLHGNVSWKAAQLVALAVLWVWSDHATLTGGFTQAVAVARTLFGEVAVTTYSGLTQTLQRYTVSLLPLLQSRLHQLMNDAGGEHWRFGRWLPIAVDGSRISTPRTQANERAFSARNFGKGSTAKSGRRWKNKRRRSRKLSAPVRPQIWLTLLWHMGLKMPWTWRTGPSTSNERRHFMEVLQSQQFPENTLFCADAGFIGYDLWTAIRAAGHHFAIRVGANVHLLRGLGRAREGREIVHIWPRNAEANGQPPMTLRLLEFQGPRGRVCIVTSVLSDHALSALQVSQLYRMRWGIELQFRSFKQTFGRRTLRSRSPGCAAVELDWSLMGLWVVQLLAVKEHIQLEISPDRSSVALALAVIRDMMRERGESCSSRTYRERMARAIHDQYQRHGSKRGRYRSATKDPPSATSPKVATATARQRDAFRKLTESTLQKS